MRRVVCTVVVALVLLVAGCTKSKMPDPTPTTAGPTASATPSAEPTSSPTAAPCQGSVTGGSDPHRASLRAWLCNDTTAMQTRMTDAAVTQLNAVPRDIDLQWTFVRCGGTAGSNYCTYRNSFGSDIIFRVSADAAQKISEVKFDRTIFHSNAEQYTRHFVEAWIGGNIQRMQALSKPAIVSFAATHAAPATPYTVTLSPSEVWIFEVTSSGTDYRFILQGQLGRSNAITDLNVL